MKEIVRFNRGSFLIGLFIVVLAILGTSGCTRLGIGSAVPSDQKTPVIVTPETVKVLGKAIDADVQVLASALEQNTDSGSVIYVDHNGYVYDAAGNIVYGPDGQPLRVRTKIIAKLNSLQNLQDLTGVAKLEYEVGGRCYLDQLPDGLKHMDNCPVPLMLRIEGIDKVAIDSPLAEQREASAKEREAILAGLSDYARARGDAFATRVTALADGTVKVVTATGKEIIGRVLGLTPLEAGIEGASNVIQAAVQTRDGTETVVAEGDAAETLQGAVTSSPASGGD